MDLRILVYITKPMLMLSLSVFYYLNIKPNLKSKDWFVIAALLFSMMGDIFLMLKPYNLFVFGLGSFLSAHLCYIFVFNKPSKLNWISRIILFIFVILFVSLLKKYVPEGLFVPVLLYAVVIGLMGMKAFERDVEKGNFQLVALGATLFIISDSLIAVNKFIEPIPYNTIWIMGTYVVAQYLIVIGVKQSKI